MDGGRDVPVITGLGDRVAVGRMRDRVYQLIAVDPDNAELLPLAVFLDVLLDRGKGAASQLVPRLGRTKPVKIGEVRKLRRALWLEFAARLDPEKTMSASAIYKAFFGFHGRFEDRGTDIQPASGDFGYRDIFWQLQRLPATVSQVVEYQTFLRWLKARREIKTMRRNVT